MDTAIRLCDHTMLGFWSGWFAGSALIGGGKLWTIITHSDLKVSELLGHIGKPIFRRQLAVGLAITYLIRQLLELLRSWLKIVNDDSITCRCIDIISDALSFTGGGLGAAALSQPIYPLIFYTVCVYSAIFALQRYKEQRAIQANELAKVREARAAKLP